MFVLFRMRSIQRVTLVLIILQQVMKEIAVALTIFTFVIYLISHNRTHHRAQRRSYTMNSRIPNQLRHLHRLVSASDESCLRNLRIDRNAFGRLCYLLEYVGVVSSTKYLIVPEQVMIFLSMVAHHKKKLYGETHFLCSGSTISKRFHQVLNAIVKLYNV